MHFNSLSQDFIVVCPSPASFRIFIIAMNRGREDVFIIFQMTPVWKVFPEGLKNRVGIQNTFDKLNKKLKQKK